MQCTVASCVAQRQRSGKAKSDGTGGINQGGKARQAPVHRHRTGAITPELRHYPGQGYDGILIFHGSQSVRSSPVLILMMSGGAPRI